METPHKLQEATEKKQLTESEIQRRKEFYRKSRERSGYEHQWFLNRRYRRSPLVFETTRGSVKGRIDKFHVYRFDVAREDGQIQKLEKLKVFTISFAEGQKTLKKNLKIHQPTQARKLEPQPNSSSKVPIPEGLVEKAIASEDQLAVMLLNGTIAIGIPVNESEFSILIKVPNLRGQQLLIFKHGIVGARLYSELKPKL
jgi:hypothetical protein